MKEYNFQTGCVRGKNYYGGKDYYIAVFPLGGKDYYIAIFPGGKATMGEKLLYNTGSIPGLPSLRVSPLIARR